MSVYVQYAKVDWDLKQGPVTVVLRFIAVKVNAVFPVKLMGHSLKRFGNI